MRINGGEPHTSGLILSCDNSSDGGGALTIQLVVPEATKHKDFDYGNFEGPDAPGSGKPFSHIAWTTPTGTTQIERAAVGWYAKDLPESFIFMISQQPQRREELARLLNAIPDEPGALAWTQTGSDNAKRQLVARFDLDAEAATRLHEAAAFCLPQNMPVRPGN
jgi:hypothetical protein